MAFKKSRHVKGKNPDYELPELHSDDSNIPKIKNSYNAPHALTAQEVLKGFTVMPQKNNDIQMQGYTPQESPLEKLRKKVTEKLDETQNKIENVVAQPRNNVKPIINTEKEEKGETLLEKCMPFITEGGNKVTESEPDYTLESVESIINLTEKKFEKIFERLDLKSAEITYDNLSKQPKPQNTNKVVDVKTAEPPQEIEMQRVEVKKEPEVISISDIDAPSSFTKTISFSSEDISSNTSLDISSGTRILDLSSELFEKEPEDNTIDTDVYGSDKEFTVHDDYKTPEDIRRVAKTLMANRRNSFIKTFFGGLIVLLQALVFIPPLQTALMDTPKPFYLVLFGIYLILVLVNFDMFVSLKSLGTPRKKAQAAAAIQAIGTLIYSVFAVINSVNPFNIIFASSVILLFKAISSFKLDSFVLNNFKKVVSKNKKYGIKFISDKQTTFAMARNSIEGDVLIASSVETENIQDFIKNTKSDTALCGGLNKYIVFSVIIAVLSALCFGLKFMSALPALEVLAFCLIVLNSPTVLFCESLPLSSAGKRLNKQGGMLTGVKAASSIDLANAVTITSSQLFPSGTITLYDMKILDSNEVDSTLIDAAAITNAIDSPLKGIFNSIAKTTPVEMPIADTIKYEERLGVSGWINDRRIFIGNRTLLEAHGITTPSIEVDKKILRQGFFPVYLASQGKPCALLIVKYNVKKDIAIKLQKLSGMGITFLIDNCDPNLTNLMVADYFGIWEESVRIMGSSGSQLNRNATEPEPYFSSPCCHGGSFTQLADVFITASKVKKSTKILSVFHVVASVIIALVFLYNSYVGAVLPTADLWFMAALAASFVLYLITYLFSKP